MVSEWKLIKLNEKADIIMGQSPKSEDCNEEGEGLPFYQGNTDFGNVFPSPTRFCINPKKIAEKNDILISVRAPVGEVNISNEKVVIGRGVSAIRPKGINNFFLFYYLKFYKAKWRRLQQGSTFTAINKGDLNSISVPNIQVNEQQKIAAILSSVDEAIEKTEQIIEQTEVVKKGLMQQLLKKGIGHKEFKNSPIGEVPYNWGIVKQGDIAEFYNGRAFKQREFVNEGTPVVRIQNLTGGPNYVYSNLLLNENKYIENGDLIYAWSATFGPYIWDGGKAIYHYHIWKISCSAEILKKYFYYKLHSLSNDSTDQKNGAVFAHLTKKFMESYRIALPPLEEQSNIVNILDSIENKIEKEKSRLNSLKDIKQGLMQQLLTGKVRVPINDSEEVRS